MARPISRQKLGYFPTPSAVVEKIRSFLGFPDRPFSALDPCCGDGSALARLTAGARALTYGIELHAGRARAASGILGRVLACGYEEARLAHGSAALLFLNAPYDQDLREDDGRALRTERRFLRDTHPYLVPGGVLVYLIPQRRLDPPTARLLSSWFEGIRVYRFPDPLYQAFRQIVIFGVRKAGAALDQNEQARLEQLRSGELPPLPLAEAPSYAVPATPAIPLFRSSRPDPELLVEEVNQSSAWRDFWASAPRLNGSPRGRPPLPLHRGHLGLLLAAGELDGVVGEGAERHLVRGLVRKEQTSWTEEEDGRTVDHTKDVFRIRVKLLFSDGTLQVLEDAGGAAGEATAERPAAPHQERSLSVRSTKSRR